MRPLASVAARAQQFLKDALVHGRKRVSDVEEAAAKAHIDIVTLEQARADLGIVVSRGNTGGAHAVQWSLPGRRALHPLRMRIKWTIKNRHR
jgi:hypothetical protein